MSLAPPASASLSVTFFAAPRALRPTFPAAVTLREARALTLSFVLLSAKARPSAKLPDASASPSALVVTSVVCVAVASSPSPTVSVASSPSRLTRVLWLVNVSATTGVIATPPFAPAEAVVLASWSPVAAIVSVSTPVKVALLSRAASVVVSMRARATLAPMPRLLFVPGSSFGFASVTIFVVLVAVRFRSPVTVTAAPASTQASVLISMAFRANPPATPTSWLPTPDVALAKNVLTLESLCAAPAPALVRSITVPATALATVVASLILPAPA